MERGSRSTEHRRRHRYPPALGRGAPDREEGRGRCWKPWRSPVPKVSSRPALSAEPVGGGRAINWQTWRSSPGAQRGSAGRGSGACPRRWESDEFRDLGERGVEDCTGGSWRSDVVNVLGGVRNGSWSPGARGVRGRKGLQHVGALRLGSWGSLEAGELLRREDVGED